MRLPGGLASIPAAIAPLMALAVLIALAGTGCQAGNRPDPASSSGSDGTAAPVIGGGAVAGPASASPPATPGANTVPVAPALDAYYEQAGGAERWGAPAGPAQCDLPDSGCLQEFAGGTLYVRGADGASGASTATGPAGHLVAAAEADVGYQAELDYYDVDTTKYNRWLDWKGPWCHIYLEWAADRAGLGELTGHYGPLFRFVDHLRADFELLDQPRVGAFALMSTSDTFSHVGLVAAVAEDGSAYTVLEGNQSEAGGAKSVLRREVAITDRLPTEFWWPPYGGGTS